MGGYVLIVESDPDLQRKIGDALKEARYELASETEGAWARRSIAVRTPDAIVVDTSLSDGDGFQLAEDLRRDPDTRDTPLFFIATRFRGASHRAEARRRFAPAEYLSMPIDVNSLLALILETVPPDGKGTPPIPDLLSPPPAPPAPSQSLSAEAGSPPAASEAAPTPVPAPAGIAEITAVEVPLKDPAQQRERRAVERSAKTLVAEKGQLSGMLKRVPFARLLQRLYAQRATGSLLLLRDTTKKIVSFVDGYPVSVRSNVLSECLGQILLGQKLISNQALGESITRMQKEKRRQGEVLVEMGALSPYNLSRALVEQVEAKLFEIFSWRDGQFMFKEGDPAPKEALRLDRPPAALILEGIRRHYDSARQLTVLDGFLGHYVRLSPDPTLRLQEMTADPTELAFIRRIDGSTRLESILDGAEIPRDKARLLLVALSEAGMIGPAEAPHQLTPPPRPDRPPSAPEDDTDVSEPEPSSGTPAKSMPLNTGQLSMVAQTVRTQDYFWALGVERDASSDDIDRAYEALARTFHSDRYRSSPDDDRKMAQEVFDRLAEAHRVLRDPARRRAYSDRIDRKSDQKSDQKTDKRSDRKGPSEPDGRSATSAGNAAAKALYDTGMEHLKARRHHEAVEAFRQAARLVPGEADFRAALGWSLFREAPADARAGRAALAELRRAIQIDGGNRRALHYLASFYAETGQPDLAIRELEKILEIDPGAAEAADQLRRLLDRS
jgi:CheY-like chemotaxis protein